MAVTGGIPVRVTVDGAIWDVDPTASEVDSALERIENGAAVLTTPAGRQRVLWASRPTATADGTGRLELELVVDGWRFLAAVEPLGRALVREKARRGAAAVARHHGFVVHAPIPGRIGAVKVADGDAVEEGAVLLTLEAMKMENVVRAPRSGTIARVAVAAGQTVELGDALVELA